MVPRKNEIPNTQFGFYPGRYTLQPMIILHHLQHAAQGSTLDSSAAHSYAYLLAASNEYILVNGCKQKMCKGLSQAIVKCESGTCN
eukprot:221350-Pelagomonas_calceolata.AAC.1